MIKFTRDDVSTQQKLERLLLRMQAEQDNVRQQYEARLAAIQQDLTRTKSELRTATSSLSANISAIDGAFSRAFATSPSGVPVWDEENNRWISTTDASPLQEGLVTTDSQSFAGDKTFQDNLIVGGNLSVLDAIYWVGGNITHVPLDGDIQTYVNAATAGDTLILASGVYTITSSITVNKQLNIVGQGHSGFVTTPVTPSHGTLITSTATLPNGAFYATNDNVRVANLSVNLTGATSVGVLTAANLQGIVLADIDVIVDGTGSEQGFVIDSSDVVLRNLTFYVTSSDGAASGLILQNDNTATKDAVCDCFNVTGTVQGGATFASCCTCYNNNSAHTLTLNLSNSVIRTNAGTPINVAVASYSLTTNNSVVNAYFCTLDGDDYDAWQTGTNELNIGGSVLVNNLTFGTINYRATMTSGNVVAQDITYMGDPVTDGSWRFTHSDSHVNLEYLAAGAWGVKDTWAP